MERQVSFAGRALTAVALMIGFYLLAIGMAAALLWVVYAEVVLFHRIHLQLTLACVVGAAVILWSVVPRPDRFEAPGPRLERERHPRLFKELESVARAAGQPMPPEVFLVNDVNAFVTERGGWMGFGGRRVMGLGLPLMQALTVPEFRGVVAHEFGHYHGGDTRLGPWVHKTRGAIGRTLEGLGDSWLQRPFVWYGNMFLRITHGISRAQEYAADALAARIVGARAMISGLRTIHGVAPLFPSFWSGEAVPVLASGFRAPLADGFRRFLEQAPIAEAVGGITAEAMKSGQGDPYDTHPPLAERVAALESLPAGPERAGAPPAVSLLGDLEGAERELLASIAGAERASKLERVEWDETGPRVFLPGWEKTAAEHAKMLSGITAGGLPERAGDREAFARPIVRVSNESLPLEEWPTFADHVVGSAIAVALHRRGFALECVPGLPVRFHHDRGSIEPFGVTARLAAKTLTPEDWRRDCAAFGILDLDLGAGPAREADT
jgi:Zn-dependent protease with chaperone function